MLALPLLAVKLSRNSSTRVVRAETHDAHAVELDPAVALVIFIKHKK
jgi:hypothetical protein